MRLQLAVVLAFALMWGSASAQTTKSLGCLPGGGWVTGLGCRWCPKGSFGRGGIQTRANGITPAVFKSCDPCTLGRTTTAASSAVKPNKFITDCNRCPAGTGYVILTTTCTACAVGKYRTRAHERTEDFSSATSAICKDCPTGTTTKTTGADDVKACSICAAGYAGLFCQECPAGYWSAGGPASAKLRCQACPTGTDQPVTSPPTAAATASAACTAALPGYGWKTIDASNNPVVTAGAYRCPKGTFSFGGTTAAAVCTSCSRATTGTVTATADTVAGTSVTVSVGPGYTTSTTGSSTCDMCKPGYESATCTPCPAGKWGAGGPALASTTCEFCPYGFSTAKTAASEQNACSICKPGFGGDGCDECPQGYFAVGGIAAGSSRCTQCPEGLTNHPTDNTLRTSCNRCEPGYGAPTGSTDTCEECGYGTWSAGGVTGSLFPTCTACSAAYTTPEMGATSAADCTDCKAGYGGTAGTCAACLVGTYSLGGDATIACAPCPTYRTTAATPAAGDLDTADECNVACKLATQTCVVTDICCSTGLACPITAPATSGTCP